MELPSTIDEPPGKAPMRGGAYLVAQGGCRIGLALREDRGLRFCAVDRRFWPLDGSRFAGPEQIRAAAESLAGVLGGPGAAIRIRRLAHDATTAGDRR